MRLISLAGLMAVAVAAAGCTSPSPAPAPTADTATATTSGTAVASPGTPSPAPGGSTPTSGGGAKPVADVALSGRQVAGLTLGTSTRDRSLAALRASLGAPDSSNRSRICLGAERAAQQIDTWGAFSLAFVDARDGRGAVLRTWTMKVSGSVTGFRLEGLPWAPAFRDLDAYSGSEVTKDTRTTTATLRTERVTYTGPAGATKPTQVTGGLPYSCS